MQGVEFEEEDDLIRSPEHVKTSKPSPFSKKGGYRINKAQAKKALMMLLLGLLLFASSGIIFYRAYANNNFMGEIITPESLTEIEKYQLPENIRKYIQ